MPTYEMTDYFTSSVCYTVEAKDVDEAYEKAEKIKHKKEDLSDLELSDTYCDGEVGDDSPLKDAVDKIRREG